MIACVSGNPATPDAYPWPDGEPEPPVDAPPPCDPIAQTGCDRGEKCAWADINGDLGVLACVPDGDRELGEPCTYGPNGENTGFDTCVAGTACDGTCRPVCSLTDDTCGAASVCARDATFGDAPFGVCQPRCEPLTQATLAGEPACGSADVEHPARGCYGSLDQEFLCRPVPQAIQAEPGSYGHGDAPLFEGVVNGCAPGYGALLSTDGGVPDLCVALCQPGPTSLEDPSNANGLVDSGHTCAERGASAANECRYIWYLETQLAPSVSPLHPDGPGFCWDPDDHGVPRCSTVAVEDQAGTGCAPYLGPRR